MKMRVFTLFLALSIAFDHAAADSVSISTNFMSEIAAALASASSEPLVMQVKGTVGDCGDATIDLGNTAATSITVELGLLGRVKCGGQVRETPMFTCNDCPPTTFRGFHFSELGSTNPNVGSSAHAAFVEILNGTVTLEDMIFSAITLTPASFPGLSYDCIFEASMMTFVVANGPDSYLNVVDTYFSDSDILHGWIVIDGGANAVLSGVSFVGNDVARCFGALVIADGACDASDCLFDSNAAFGAGDWFHESEIIVYGGSNFSLTNSQYSTANSQNFLSAGYLGSTAFVTVDNFILLDCPNEDHQLLFDLRYSHFSLSNSSFFNLNETFGLSSIILAYEENYVEVVNVFLSVPLAQLHHESSMIIVDCISDYPVANPGVGNFIFAGSEATGDIAIFNSIFNGSWEFDFEGEHAVLISGCLFDGIFDIEHYGDDAVVVIENSNIIDPIDAFFHTRAKVESITVTNVNYTGNTSFLDIYEFGSASISYCNFDHVNIVIFAEGGNVTITNSNINDGSNFAFVALATTHVIVDDVNFDDVFAIGVFDSDVDIRNVLFRNQKEEVISLDDVLYLRGGSCMNDILAILTFLNDAEFVTISSSRFENIKSRLLIADRVEVDVVIDGIDVQHASKPLFRVLDYDYMSFGEPVFILRNSNFDDVLSIGYIQVNSAFTNLAFLNQFEYTETPCGDPRDTDVFHFSGGNTANLVDSSRFETISGRIIFAEHADVAFVNVNMSQIGMVSTNYRGYLRLEDVNIEHVSGTSPFFSYYYFGSRSPEWPGPHFAFLLYNTATVFQSVTVADVADGLLSSYDAFVEIVDSAVSECNAYVPVDRYWMEDSASCIQFYSGTLTLDDVTFSDSDVAENPFILIRNSLFNVTDVAINDIVGTSLFTFVEMNEFNTKEIEVSGVDVDQILECIYCDIDGSFDISIPCPYIYDMCAPSDLDFPMCQVPACTGISTSTTTSSSYWTSSSSYYWTSSSSNYWTSSSYYYSTTTSSSSSSSSSSSTSSSSSSSASSSSSSSSFSSSSSSNATSDTLPTSTSALTGTSESTATSSVEDALVEDDNSADGLVAGVAVLGALTFIFMVVAALMVAYIFGACGVRKNRSYSDDSNESGSVSNESFSDESED